MKLRPRSMLATQSLESRLAPAAFFHYTDVDGDKITITSSLGANVDLMNAAHVAGGQLQKLNLSTGTFGGEFQNADITFSVVRATGGDGLANVGYIDATGIDLGVVSVKGDLGQIDAGDATTATPGLKALSVRSLGRFGIDTQVGGGSLQSDIKGALGALVVVGDVKDARVSVSGGADGTIGAITIRGSLIGGSTTSSGEIFSSGDMGAVKIGHDLQGGAGPNSGFIQSGGKLAGVTIGGSLIGGSNDDSGEIVSVGDMGLVRISHNVQGGSGVQSGFISSSGKLAGVTVGGSLIGGSGTLTGTILSALDMGVVKIGQNLKGGSGGASGLISCSGKLAGVSIGGSILGGSNLQTGEVFSEGDMGAVKIGHDVQGGSISQSGWINCIAGKIAGVSIGGSLIGGSSVTSGEIHSTGDMGAVKIGGDVQGGSGSGSGFIDSAGKIASVSIGGSLIGDSGPGSGNIHSGGDMGLVKIGHDVQGGSGSGTGIIRTDGKFGGASIGGSLIGGSNLNSGEILSSGDMGAIKIGHNFVGGSISGTTGTLDESGFIQCLGGRIASVSIGGSIISGIDTSTGGSLTKNASIRAEDDIGSIAVAGSLIGNTNANGDSPVIISARGQHTVLPGATSDRAIGRIAIGGRVEFARILAGYGIDLSVAGISPANADAQIGAVTVGGDWAASSLVAGVAAGGDGTFGTADDAKISGGGTTDTASIVSKIASVTIKGLVYGTPAASGSDHFGFVAQQIGLFKALGVNVALTPGIVASLELALTTGDVTLRQVA